MKQWTIARAVQTCFACPSQWDAWTEDGRYLYLRFRHGHGTAQLFPGPGVNWEDGSLVAEFDEDEPLGGFIGLEDFCRRAGLTLALTTPETENYL